MKRKERVLTGKLARPVSIELALVKAKMAGYGTNDGRSGSKPRIISSIDGVGQITAEMSQADGIVYATVSRPGCDTARLRIRTVPELQDLIKSLSR